ncbi:MAG TPA: hypothetical protein VG318_17980 [Actinomycetota bacterium]|nr:hypothetical protein [Actinomycetota bacterium]
MGWWSEALRTKAAGWTFGAFDAAQVPDGLAHAPVAPDETYLSGFLRSMWVTDVRKGVSRFYGTLQSHVSLPHLGGLAEFQVVVAPPDLRDIDGSNAHRFVTRNIRLFGPVPYRGGDLEIELGLFSVKAGDLVGPFVDMLEAVSGAAGLSLVAAARPFVEPVRKGFDLLLGIEGDATLEIGLAATFSRPETGYFVVMRKEGGSTDLSRLTVGPDYRLLAPNGEALADHPYVLVAIESSTVRDDWFQIPDLAAAYGTLRDDVAKGRLPNVQESVAVFKRTALTSPDLLTRDAVRLVEKVGGEIDQTLRLTQTSGGPNEMPPFAALSLYDP